MSDMDGIKEKFESSVFEHLNKENAKKIIDFLFDEKCDYVEDILDDYLDLFKIPYEEFVEKYHILNEKYNGVFLVKASEDMNLLEEFYE